jgi:hypothetical protein
LLASSAYEPVYMHVSSLLDYINKLFREATRAFVYQVNVGTLSQRLFIKSKK